MKKMTYLFLLAATLGACSPKPENKIETPPKASASLFPQGDAIEGSNFNGTAYLQRLMTDSETFDMVVSDVIFEPKARNSWHSRKRLLSGKGEAYTSVESRRCSRYSGRCGALARSGSRQRIHAYSYQYKSSFGCYTVV